MAEGAEALALGAILAVGQLDGGEELVGEIAAADNLAFDVDYLCAFLFPQVSVLIPGLDLYGRDPVEVGCHLFQIANDLEDELIGAALRQSDELAEALAELLLDKS